MIPSDRWWTLSPWKTSGNQHLVGSVKMQRFLTEQCSVVVFSSFSSKWFLWHLCESFTFYLNCWIITMSFIFEGLLPGRLLIMNRLVWAKQRADSVPGGHAPWRMKQCRNPGKGKALLVQSDLRSGSTPSSFVRSLFKVDKTGGFSVTVLH